MNFRYLTSGEKLVWRKNTGAGEEERAHVTEKGTLPSDVLCQETHGALAPMQYLET